MRHLAISAVLAALLAACARAPVPEEPIRAVRSMTLDTAPVVAQQEYAAEIRARTESRLAFRVGGKVVRRLVEVGQVVKPGQPLAEIDPQDLRLGQQAAQAALAAATANLALAENEFKRYQELRNQGFVSGVELDRRETTLKAARAQAEQVRAQAGVQGNQAAYAVLLADAGGIVTGVDVEPGAVVGAGTPVLRLAHDGPRDVVFNLPEGRVAGIRPLLGRQNALRLTLWSDGSRLPATLREIGAAADPVTRTYLVKADVGAASVRLGQTATVTVESPPQANVIRLPLAAVFEREGQPSVWLLDKATMTLQPRRIRVAGADGNLVTVAEGLQPGLTVVTAGVHTLVPGQRVRLYAEPGALAAAQAPKGAGNAPMSSPASVR